MLSRLLLVCVMIFSLLGCASYTPSVTIGSVNPKPPEVTSLEPSVVDFLPGLSSSSTKHLKDVNVVVSQYSRAACGGTVVRSDNEATLVLTASHCVLVEDQTVMEFGFIHFNGDDSYRVVVIDINRDQDLALLKVTDKIELKDVAILANVVPDEKEDIWVIGFGAGQEDIVSHGTVAIKDTTSIHTPRTRCTLIDSSTYYGNSGGGVFNDRDELFGVLIQNGPQHPADGLWSYIVYIDEIQKFLQPHLK